MDKKSRFLLILLLISIFYVTYLTYDQTILRKNFEVVNFNVDTGDELIQ